MAEFWNPIGTQPPVCLRELLSIHSTYVMTSSGLVNFKDRVIPYSFAKAVESSKSWG